MSSLPAYPNPAHAGSRVVRDGLCGTAPQVLLRESRRLLVLFSDIGIAAFLNLPEPSS
jgi:hypothetical protein